MVEPRRIGLPTYETLLTEAIGSLTVDSGTVTGAAAVGGNSLTDTTKNWATNVHRNRLVSIVRGTGAGQVAVIDSNSDKTLIIKQAWAKPLDTTSVYVILSMDVAQVLRDVFGGGSDISAANPLETHDPKVGDIEDKLDHPDHGLAALKAAIGSLAGGAFYGSYGPRNVEVANDVDFGTILYDPSGNIITTGEITPGTYTVRRVRGAVDTEIVASTASSEAAGRVYMTYNFPAANWQVGDIFYITFSGIQVTIDGVTTEYPNLFIWGRVVREADISSKVDAIEGKLDLPAADETANTTVGEVIGQKVDAANETADEASIIGLLRAVITNYLNDGTNGLANLKTLIDAIETKLDTPATFMADVSALALEATLTTTDGKVDTVGGNVDNILLDTQIRKVVSGTSGAIAAAGNKYIEIDSGTNGAEILAVIINGVVGFDWTLEVYAPTADAVAAPAAADKRDEITYLNTDTEGGLLKPFAIAYNAFLKFTNDSGGNQTVNDVVVVYRSRAAITIGAWT